MTRTIMSDEQMKPEHMCMCALLTVLFGRNQIGEIFLKTLWTVQPYAPSMMIESLFWLVCYNFLLLARGSR